MRRFDLSHAKLTAIHNQIRIENQNYRPSTQSIKSIIPQRNKQKKHYPHPNYLDCFQPTKSISRNRITNSILDVSRRKHFQNTYSHQQIFSPFKQQKNVQKKYSMRFFQGNKSTIDLSFNPAKNTQVTQIQRQNQYDTPKFEWEEAKRENQRKVLKEQNKISPCKRTYPMKKQYKEDFLYHEIKEYENYKQINHKYCPEQNQFGKKLLTLQ